MTALNQNALFEEEQKFCQTWLWVTMLPTLLLVTAIFGAGLYQQLYLGQPFGNKPMSNAGLIAVAIFANTLTLGLLILFFVTKLSTRLANGVLEVKFFPFKLKRIALNDIIKCEACKYRPVGDFGGWGIRYGGRKKGWAYNVSSNRGVQLALADGKLLLIGSQRAEELAAAIQQAQQR